MNFPGIQLPSKSSEDDGVFRLELSSGKGKPLQKIVLLTAMMFVVFEASTTCWNLSVYVAVSLTVILSVLVLNAITECHRLGDLNSRYLFSTVLEARKSKIKEPADLVSGENFLSCGVLTGQRGRKSQLFGVTTYKDINPLRSELHSYDLI